MEVPVIFHLLILVSSRSLLNSTVHVLVWMGLITVAISVRMNTRLFTNSASQLSRNWLLGDLMIITARMVSSSFHSLDLFLSLFFLFFLSFFSETVFSLFLELHHSLEQECFTHQVIGSFCIFGQFFLHLK